MAWAVGFGLDDLLLGFGEIGFGFSRLNSCSVVSNCDDDVAGLRPVRRDREGR